MTPQSRLLVQDKKPNTLSNVVKLKVPKGKTPIEYCNELRKAGDLVYADPIVQYQLLSTPSDPLISNQYYLDNIRAYDAWEITRGDDDITIGIVDTGLDLGHEDITSNLWLNTDDPVDGVDNDENGYVDDYYGYDFADTDTDPTIQNGNHGMIVGGIASASTNNGKGIAGVGYNTKVAALKSFRTSNGTSNGLYEAIIYAAENGFEVVNLSWGRMGTPLQSEQDIINYAVLDHDMVVVAAAGNEGGKVTEEARFYPASYDNVLSIGGSDADDHKSSGSSFNYSVDLLAPGVSMFSTIKNDGYTNGGPGTSFAAPQVAAAAALVRDQFPTLTAIQVMERVRATADDIYDIGSNATHEGKLGKGRLNVLRAVSESNVKSLRAENPSLTSRYGNAVFYGDTVQVSATLTNHLSSINSPLVTISSPNDDFTVSQGSFQPGFMKSLDTKDISFEVILNEDLAPETQIGIRLDYSAAGYNDFQYLEVTTSPDYADFGNEKISMTISGDSDLGFNEYEPELEGSGLQYQLDTLMTYAGLMLATNSSNVSDNIISNYTNQSRNQDFSVQKNYKLYHHPAADYFGYSEFTDLNRPLIIEQSNITWSDEDFLIVRYRIVNNSAAAINDLSIGLFADWDLGDATQNFAAYDAVDNYIYTRNATGDLYAGVQVNGGDNIEFSALDMGAFNGNVQDIDDLFSDASKYDFLVNQSLTEAGSFGSGNDVATINGVTITQLAAFEEAFVDVFFAISDSPLGLKNEFQVASNRLDDFLLKPRVQETFYTCDGTAVNLDPSAGTTYEFYEDPLAQTLITTATSFNPGTITKDTTFYVKNLDNGYPSDVFAIRLNLLNEISNFEMSTDTLYLDHPTTNVVQFTDQSLDAIDWSWDFGEGTISSLQNPSFSFSQTGTYIISLTIENELGCADMISKSLVVANRPSQPIIANQVICPGEDVTLNDPTAEKIHLYAFASQTEPLLSGSNLIIPEVNFDTTIYVSGVYGSFESSKVPVQIDVLEVNGSIFVRPDTLSETHQMIFEAVGVDAGASLAWVVDGEPAGGSSAVSAVATEGVIDVSLTITSPDACEKTILKKVSISTSPFASLQDLVSCSGEEVALIPENGEFFGFYEDAGLTKLISKGTRLITNQYEKVYVVSLDDGLPGMPIEVNITNRTIEIEIAYILTLIGQKHKVKLFAVSDDPITSYSWYVNGELAETSQNPTFFFDDGVYEIELRVFDEAGCSNTASMSIDLTEPLGIDESGKWFYPNPTKGIVRINSDQPIEGIQVVGIDGKLVLEPEVKEGIIDLSGLSKGLYIVKLKLAGGIISQSVLIE